MGFREGLRRGLGDKKKPKKKKKKFKLSKKEEEELFVRFRGRL